jgi:carotenoid cleavage dioxygenase
MITERFVLVLDLPVTFSMSTLVSGYSFPYRWNPAHRARVGVLGRDEAGDRIVWCEVDPCYVFHTVNAFENADGRITLDVVAHSSMFAHSHFGPDAPATALERWTVDPVARRVTRAVRDAEPQEFPRIDERRTGRPYRYAYTAAFEPDGAHGFRPGTRLIKHDLQAAAREAHDFGPGRHPGEFVFHPRSADSSEDEGWLMGYVVDARRQTTDFVVLAANDFRAAPVAVVRLPHRIPAGFHGNWVPDEAARGRAGRVGED